MKQSETMCVCVGRTRYKNSNRYLDDVKIAPIFCSRRFKKYNIKLLIVFLETVWTYILIITNYFVVKICTTITFTFKLAA